MMGNVCGKCKTITGALFLVAGVLYLLTDLGMISFWKFSWYTVLFLLMGIGGVASMKCKDCQALSKK